MQYLNNNDPVSMLLKTHMDAPTMLGLIRNVQPAQTMFGAELFPVQSTDMLTYSYFKEANQAVPMAGVVSYRAESPIIGDVTSESMFGQICKISVKKPLHEDVIMKIDRAGKGDPQAALKKISDDIVRLSVAVRERQEALRVEALTTGKLDINENGIKTTLDFGLPADQKVILGGTSRWSDPTSNPVEDLELWVEIMAQNMRIRPTRAWTSRRVLACLRKNELIREYIMGKDHSGRPISTEQINNMFEEFGLPKFSVYERYSTVELPDGTVKNYNPFPENMITLLPEGPLGVTLEGPVAESILDGNISTEKRAGLWFNSWQEADPVTHWQKVSASSLPTFPRIEHVFHATVI